jgi:hypothetical protein
MDTSGRFRRRSGIGSHDAGTRRWRLQRELLCQAMNLDPAWLALSLITGAIGLGLFIYGKRASRWPHAVVGLLFMVYPYFTPNISSLVVVGVVLAGVLWYLMRTGR